MTLDSHSLSRTALFAALEQDEVQALDSRCTWHKASAGEWVIDDHSVGTDVFFVLYGHTRVVTFTSSREIILRDIHDGEYFGEISAIDGRPRSAGILAITDTAVVRMSAKVFHEMIHRHQSVCDQVLANLAGRVRALSDRVTEQTNFNVHERLCAELLRLSRIAADGRVVISPPPTHAELAARISSHREAVTKQLSALEREAAISRTRGAIVLVNPERLCRIVAEAG
jgi:CRP/FNR family transcriptional regulator, cyclic AMP receptor protein